MTALPTRTGAPARPALRKRTIAKAAPLPVDVATLDDAAVLARVFPRVPGAALAGTAGWRARNTATGWTSGGLPEGWVPGRPPVPAVPIDAEVRRLVEPRPFDNLALAEAHLAALGIGCPYFAGRQAVMMAARVARHEAALRSAATQAASDADVLRDLADEIERVLSRLPADIEAAAMPLDRRPDPIRAWQRTTEAAARRERIRAALLDIRVEVDEHDAARASVERPNVRRAFARSLGFAWFVLTGQKPSPKDGSRFLAFVSAAHATLAPDDEVDWTSPAKLARREIESWPRWAGVDWMINAGLPGVALSRRPYRTADEARAGAGREVARLLSVSRPLLAETRAALEAYGADLVALSVATAGDSTADFDDVLELARRVAVFQRGVFDSLRRSGGGVETAPSATSDSDPGVG